MNEIEALLRKARPEGPPAYWKHQILEAATRRRAETGTWPSRFAWGALAVCWMAILGLYLSTPDLKAPGEQPMVKRPTERSTLVLEFCKTEFLTPADAPERKNVPPQASSTYVQPRLA